MTEQELRGLIATCNQRERVLKAPHGKARRGWTDLRRQAEADLEARSSERL